MAMWFWQRVRIIQAVSLAMWKELSWTPYGLAMGFLGKFPCLITKASVLMMKPPVAATPTSFLL